MMAEKESEQAAWYAVRTQLKREKLAALKLRELEGVEVFHPRIRYRKATRRGPVWWVEPLFPSYLLVKFQLVEQGRLVGYAPGVSHVLKFGTVSPSVPDKLVEELRAEWRSSAEDDGEEIQVERLVEVGDQVEVARGAFQGIEGQVVRVKAAAQRVEMLLEFLGEERAVEIDLLDLILESGRESLAGRKSPRESE
ncbi:MAG: transcription termination/antitermination protein NusG [Verrucomicrobiales bacterium]